MSRRIAVLAIVLLALPAEADTIDTAAIKNPTITREQGMLPGHMVITCLDTLDYQQWQARDDGQCYVEDKSPPQ